MRGGCAARLVCADDGHYYVVKTINNPQGGRRTLVNEFVSHVLMRLIGIDTPLIALAIDHSGAERDELHFASRFPGDPETTAVYDFLPDKILSTVVNREAFFGALVLDQRISQLDGRQSIFFRAKIQSPGTSQDGTVGWVTQFIDNGHAFQANWSYADSPMQGIYCRRSVYGEGIQGEDFWPWVERAMQIKRNTVIEAIEGMPKSWIRGEEKKFANLISGLMYRQQRLGQLVLQSVKWIRNEQREKRAH
jgi:hypothetical protein